MTRDNNKHVKCLKDLGDHYCSIVSCHHPNYDIISVFLIRIIATLAVAYLIWLSHRASSISQASQT